MAAAKGDRSHSNGDTKLINDLDKKVALLAQDLTYVKQGVDDQKEALSQTNKNITGLSDSFRDMKIVTPEALTAYMQAQETVNKTTKDTYEDHEKRIKSLEDAALAEKNTYFSRLRTKIGDRAVDIGLTIFYAIVAFVLLQLLTGGSVLQTLLKGLT